MTTFLEDW